MFLDSGLVSSGGGSSVIQISHPGGSGYDGLRSVLGVITFPATVTVTSITEAISGNPGGWTLRGSHTAHDRNIYIYDKICGPGEVTAYNVTVSNSTSTKTVIIADFDTAGDAIRTFGFADAASGTLLTLPSLSASNADDIWAFAGGVLGNFRPDPPLTQGDGFGGTSNASSGYEAHQSSAATGTRSFTSTFAAPAFGVMMLVGQFAPAGGWGVGMVRMGTN